MGTQLPPKSAQPPIFGPCLLSPDGCMYQNATWYGCRPHPRRHCVRWGCNPPPKRGIAPSFWSCLLWPNGWMDEDATWYGSRPWPRPHCVRRWPSSPAKGAQQPSPLVPCLLWLWSPISATAELLLKVTCSYVHCISGNILDMMKDTDIVTKACITVY